jgi:ectoine hydroxylase-related dioxygenase (phytanoyl-CoA dioxygenase family)
MEYTMVANTPNGEVSLTAAQIGQFHEEGYLIVKGLIPREQIEAIRARFDALGESGEAVEGYWEPKRGSSDVLQRYPRVMHPHRFDELSRKLMLHPRTRVVLQTLLGEEPVACQSMFYFKPSGARGQAFHQDNFYLSVQPSTCLAGWVAVDRSYPQNGGLMVVPRTQTLDLKCPEMADTGESFTQEVVRPPAGTTPVPAVMEPGDVLFFNGNVIHGSGPNQTTDEWRRSFICHYMAKSSTHISQYYFPIMDFDGRELSYEVSKDGGPCGTEVAAKEAH